MLKTNRNTFIFRGSGYLLVGNEHEPTLFEMEIDPDFSSGHGHLIASQRLAQAAAEKTFFFKFAPYRYWRLMIDQVRGVRIFVTIVGTAEGERP